jgi:hypothetical protein
LFVAQLQRISNPGLAINIVRTALMWRGSCCGRGQDILQEIIFGRIRPFVVAWVLADDRANTLCAPVGSGTDLLSQWDASFLAQYTVTLSI